MVRISARDASRGFAALLDRVEHDAEEYTVVREGRPVARIVPVTTHTLGDFRVRRTGRLPLDESFAADARRAEHLIAHDSGDPWRD